MKIYQCFPNLAAQTWFYTDDNRIALQDKGKCLDLPGGDTTNGNYVQVWQCTDNDIYQVWTRDDVHIPEKTSMKPSPTSTPVPAGKVVQIHPNGDTSKCLDVKDGNFGNEQPVQT